MNNQSKFKTVLSIVYRIFGGVLVLFLLFIVVFNVLTSIERKKTNDPIPMVFNHAVLIVLSGSMEPTILVNDAVVIKFVEPSQLKVGDVITYVRINDDGEQSRPVTHRIVSIDFDKQVVRTKGDNPFNSEDPYDIKFEEIRGVVVKTFSQIGKVVDFFKNPIGLSVIFLLGCALIFLPDVINKKQYVEEDIEDTELYLKEQKILKLRQEILEEKNRKEQEEKNRKEEDENNKE